MTLPIHPRWGLAIGFYEPFCNLIRSGVSSNSKIAGLQAMQKISRLASERRIPAQRELGKDIYMSTLQAALHLAMDPMTIAHLADPPVISGCIQLMKGVIGESRGVASPFTYEYGSLCFELLVCAVNICLMQRWGKLDEAYAQYLETGGHNPELAPYLWASVGLSSVVQQQFEILKNGGDCDWVLGWPTSTSHPRQTPLVALSDVSTLLELLWNDRKHFSTAMARCYPAAFGLSGLLFIFSRYIAINDTRRDPGREVLKTRLFELSLRYMLSADQSQRAATLHIIYANACDISWLVTPKHLDPEDSQSLISLFIHLLSGEISKTLLIREAAAIFRLVPLAVDTSSQDQLPEVIKYIIKYGWSILIHSENNDVETLVQTFFEPLLWLIQPPHNRPYRLQPKIQKQIIDVLYQGDFLDWTAAVIARRLDLANTNTRDISLASISSFFAGLAKAIPRGTLKERFQDYAPNWRGFHAHLLFTRGAIANTPTPGYQAEYSQCIQTWFDIVRFLGLDDELNTSSMNCASRRCPGAHIIGSPKFGCAGCVDAIYCDDRCQASDWKFGDHKLLHGE